MKISLPYLIRMIAIGQEILRISEQPKAGSI